MASAQFEAHTKEFTSCLRTTGNANGARLASFLAFETGLVGRRKSVRSIVVSGILNQEIIERIGKKKGKKKERKEITKLNQKQ